MEKSHRKNLLKDLSFQLHNKQGNQRWQTSPAAPPGGLGHGNVHVKFHDDRLRNGGDITY